jgi:type IV fimbrial biogenesis protein FimT
MKVTENGFTLIELMIALTILAILVGMAAPSFRELSRNNRVVAAQNDLVTAFNLARSEALKRGAPVTVCASVNGTACGAAADWASGWIVFDDRAGAAGTVNNGDTVLQRWGAVDGNIVFAATAAFVQYQPTGTVVPDQPATFNISYSGCVGAKKRQVAVSAIGSLQSTKANCS